LGCCWTVAAGHGNLAGQSEISRLIHQQKNRRTGWKNRRIRNVNL
jgi:hypothetical protein